MTLDELKEEVNNALKVNDERLDTEALKNQELYAKYLDHKSRFELLLHKAKGDYKKMYREKWEYYGGKADAKVYAAKPFDLKVLKTDLQMYINSDEEILAVQGKIAYYESIIKYIDGVIKSIDNRGWDIRNATEWKKFEAGMV